MKEVILNLLVISLLLTSIAIAGEWTDDFDDEAETTNNWTPIAGEWKVEAGFYKGQMGTFLGATITDMEIGDGVTIMARSQYVSGGWENFGVIFAYVDDTEAYQADIRGGNDTLRIEKFTPNTKTVQVLAQGNQVSNFSEWFDVEIVIEGDTVIVSIDEDEIVRHTFPDGLPEGKIGFGGEESHVEFDNITIMGPGIGDMAVSSTGKLSTAWGEMKQ